MDEAKFKPIAKNFLKKRGFRVNEVPLGDHAWTPNFEVVGEKDKYAIVLQTMGDDPLGISKGPPNRLARFVRKGVRKLVEHDLKGDAFRVIWLHCSGKDPRSIFRQFHATLFGTEKIFSLKISDVITCYYFRESAFSLWRNCLDGVILTSENEAQLCVNTLSPRLEKFRESELAVRMSEGLCDPERLDQALQEVMIADCTIDRRDSDAIINYLSSKYGIDHLQILRMRQRTAMIYFLNE
jgi:hypothetical protein